MADTTDSPIRQDLEFQQLEWRLERVVWVLSAAVILAALLGLLGAEGPFDHRESSSGNGLLRADYQRFPHVDSPTGIDFQINPSAREAGQAKLSIDSHFMSGYEIQQVTPDPESVTAERDHIVYTFDVGAGPSEVSFDLAPSNAGRHSGYAETTEGGRVHISQFVYP
jgi:hypothetical protein